MNKLQNIYTIGRRRGPAPSINGKTTISKMISSCLLWCKMSGTYHCVIMRNEKNKIKVNLKTLFMKLLKENAIGPCLFKIVYIFV